MEMTKAVAQQVADLINAQNKLSVQYTAARVLSDQDQYILREDAGTVLGVVEVKKVQWYQCEIDHVSVAIKRHGIGTWLVEQGERRAKDVGARIVQCTIRVGNKESEGLFKGLGYEPAVVFQNEATNNTVRVFQKVLVPPSDDAA